MFYGEHAHTMDRKGRLIIPAKFRQALRANAIETLFLTRGFEECLFLFAEAEWRVTESQFKQRPFTRASTRTFNRLFFSGAVEVKPDRLGRLLIPKNLRVFAHIQHDVVVVGVSNRMEIWAKDKWQAFYETSRQRFEEVGEGLLPEP